MKTASKQNMSTVIYYTATVVNYSRKMLTSLATGGFLPIILSENEMTFLRSRFTFHFWIALTSNQLINNNKLLFYKLKFINLIL